jgi:hypothetical protein
MTQTRRHSNARVTRQTIFAEGFGSPLQTRALAKTSRLSSARRASGCVRNLAAGSVLMGTGRQRRGLL